MQQSETGFFKLVWRFNALAIAVAATIVVVVGLVAAFEIFRDTTRPRRVTNVVNVGVQDKILEEFSLGSPNVIGGTSLVRVSLLRGQSYNTGSLPLPKSSQQNLVNYLFLNVSTNESRWLFNGVGQLVIEERTLFNKIKESPDQPRIGVAEIYVIVERDSNGDNRLTDKDAVLLATSAVDGTNYKNLVEGIDQLYSVQQITDDKVLVLYQKNKETFSEVYSVPSMSRLTRTSVPKVNLN